MLVASNGLTAVFGATLLGEFLTKPTAATVASTILPLLNGVGYSTSGENTRHGQKIEATHGKITNHHC